jgi:hypothetical protein
MMDGTFEDDDFEIYDPQFESNNSQEGSDLGSAEIQGEMNSIQSSLINVDIESSVEASNSLNIPADSSSFVEIEPSAHCNAMQLSSPKAVWNTNGSQELFLSTENNVGQVQLNEFEAFKPIVPEVSSKGGSLCSNSSPDNECGNGTCDSTLDAVSWDRAGIDFPDLSYEEGMPPIQLSWEDIAIQTREESNSFFKSLIQENIEVFVEFCTAARTGNKDPGTIAATESSHEKRVTPLKRRYILKEQPIHTTLLSCTLNSAILSVV